MTETWDAPWPRPDGRVTNLPRALILDLDDTILDAYGNPSEAWLKLCHEFAGQLGSVMPRALHAAILEARDWVWSDPERDVTRASTCGRADDRSYDGPSCSSTSRSHR